MKAIEKLMDEENNTYIDQDISTIFDINWVKLAQLKIHTFVLRNLKNLENERNWIKNRKP